MTLPKKGRRNITVDGLQYHWGFDPFRLFGNDSFICVQDATGHGPLLKIQWVGIALPSHIESAIRFALGHGWTPIIGEILEIGADSRTDRVAFEIKPDGAPRYWFYDKVYGEYSPRNPNNPNVVSRSEKSDPRTPFKHRPETHRDGDV